MEGARCLPLGQSLKATPCAGHGSQRVTFRSEPVLKEEMCSLRKIKQDSFLSQDHHTDLRLIMSQEWRVGDGTRSQSKCHLS